MSDAPRKPRPRFGWRGISGPPEPYYYDFSYHMRFDSSWVYLFDIPPGGDPHTREHEVQVWEAQREYGCANVCSGGKAASIGMMGVYAGPHHGKHRTEMSFNGKPMCRCFE